VFRTYEKLDGTNLGVRCDGAVFGRRLRISGDSYQKVPLAGTIPTGKEVQAVKDAMLGQDAKHGTELVLCGELMCNPSKFDHNERAMGGKFCCFGAMLKHPKTATDNEVITLQQKLKQRGFAPLIGENAGRIVLNHKMRELLESQGVTCVPLMDEGPFVELCFRMKESLMNDGMEGVVLMGDEGSLLKWKTSIEDESETHGVLCSLMRDHFSLPVQLP
jgi:hypothetical protein